MVDTNTVETVIAFGPWVAILVLFIVPFLFNKLLPGLMETHKLRTQFEQEQERRLYDLVQKNTEAFVSLREAINQLGRHLDTQREQLYQQGKATQRLNDELADLYSRLQLQRPSAKYEGTSRSQTQRAEARE